MLRTTILLAFILFSTFMGAQKNATELAKNDVFGNPFNINNQSHIRALNRLDNRVDMSKYFMFPEWSAMEAFGIDGQYMLADSANFLLKENKILFYSDGEMLQLFTSVTEKVKVGNKLFMPFTSTDKSNMGLVEFYEVVVDGEFKLLKDWKLEEKVISNNPMGVADTDKVTIVKSSELFYINPKGDLVSIPRKKKDFIEIFGRNRRKMIDFAQKNNMSVKKEGDIAQFFTHYNLISNEEK